MIIMLTKELNSCVHHCSVILISRKQEAADFAGDPHIFFKDKAMKLIKI